MTPVLRVWLWVGVLALAVLALVVMVAHGDADAAPGGISWAVVRVDGTLARGAGAVSSARMGADGAFQVIFNHDVSGCGYVATAGEPGSFPPDDSISMGVASLQGNPDGVALIEYDAILARDNFSSGFHLMVVC